MATSGFHARVLLSVGDHLFSKNNKMTETTLYSVGELVLFLRESKDEEIRSVNLVLTLSEECPQLLSEWEKLAESGIFQSFSGRLRVQMYHLKDYDTETAFKLKKELNKIIKRRVKFLELKLGYADEARMTEEEVEAMVEGIEPVHKDVLPLLFLKITSPAVINLLDQCAKLDWPVHIVSIKSKDWKNQGFDWKQLKRAIKGFNLNLKLENLGNDTDVEVLPIVQALLSGDGDRSIRGFNAPHRWLHALVDPGSARWKWKNLTTDKIKELEFVEGFEPWITVEETKISIVYPNRQTLLDLLGTIYRSGEERWLGIERFTILAMALNKDEKRELRSRVEQLMLSLINLDHDLLSFNASISSKNVEIPYKLQQQIDLNLSKKMSIWIESGTEVVYGRLKVMLVGQGRAGKSSTIRSLLKQPFDKNLESTLVAEADKDISISVQDVSKWKETNLKKNWLAEEMGEYLNKVEKDVNDRGDILIPVTPISKKLVKSESKAKELSTDLISEPKLNNRKMAQNVKNQINMNRNKGIKDKDDDKDNVRLTIWDFGGQQIFYALHHLYLTRGGVYVLVFDLSLMKEQMEEELRVIEFWLNSVQLHAAGASVVMVGTRCNQVKEDDIEKIDYELTNLIEDKKVNHLEAEDLSFFPIDNSDQENIEKQIEPLRSIIFDQSKVEEQEEDKVLNISKRKVPLNWIYFMNNLVTKFKDCITANQLFEEGKQMNLDRKRDIIPMLEFYKNAGAIIPFMKGSVDDEPLISDYVVLSPEWLLQILGSFIYDPVLHKRKKALIKRKDMSRLIAKYEKTGIFSKTLLLFILNQAKVRTTDYEFILQLCQEMLIMSKFDFKPKWSTIKDDSFFLVPTMNKQVATEERIQQDAAVKDCFNIFLHFSSAIPIGLFERVICVMLTCNRDFDGTTTKPFITKNFARFCFRETEVFLVDEHMNGDFRISLNKVEGSDLNIIINLLQIGSMVQQKLKSDVLGKHLDSTIDIKSLDEKGYQFRCSFEALMNAVSKEKIKVPMIDSTGDERLKDVSQLNLFGEAAQLIVERQKPKKEQKKLKWHYHCFLAHTWGPNNVTHDQVVKIDELLREMKFKTWLDEANLKYFVANDIVDGLKKSSCVLVFITELYLEKVEDSDTNASKEFAQAVSKGTEYMVPVVLDPKCLDPKSWLGSTVGYNFSDALYFDFSSDEKIKANIGRLGERIEEMSKAERPPTLFDE